MTNNRLPSRAQFSKLGANQEAVLDWHRRQIEDEFAGLQSCEIIVDHRGRAYHLRNSRRRMMRLAKLAHDFGYWQD